MSGGGPVMSGDTIFWNFSKNFCRKIMFSSISATLVWSIEIVSRIAAKFPPEGSIIAYYYMRSDILTAIADIDIETCSPNSVISR